MQAHYTVLRKENSNIVVVCIFGISQKFRLNFPLTEYNEVEDISICRIFKSLYNLYLKGHVFHNRYIYIYKFLTNKKPINRTVLKYSEQGRKRVCATISQWGMSWHFQGATVP